MTCSHRRTGNVVFCRLLGRCELNLPPFGQTKLTVNYCCAFFAALICAAMFGGGAPGALAGADAFAAAISAARPGGGGVGVLDTTWLTGSLEQPDIIACKTTTIVPNAKICFFVKTITVFLIIDLAS